MVGILKQKKQNLYSYVKYFFLIVEIVETTAI
jgi:hypothetical protein